MASRIMHLCVAKLVAEKYRILSEEEFYYGALAPDLSNYDRKNYFESHYINVKGDVKGIDYQQFITKYYTEIIEGDFAKGYLVHLITDAIWLKTIQQPYVRTCQDKKHELYQKGYQDMKIFNSLLIKKYGLMKMEMIIIESYIEEIELNDFENLLIDLNLDFDHIDEQIDRLQVYPYDSVNKFIGNSTDKCVDILKLLSSGEKSFDVQKYYVPK